MRKITWFHRCSTTKNTKLTKRVRSKTVREFRVFRGKILLFFLATWREVFFQCCSPDCVVIESEIM
ncbi:MAG: hypothetical protein COA78_29695 [Blastopirellula sp.]|nr:MAG: hypothetical protein COA78_29695 [Blastopirellula sp.]